MCRHLAQNASWVLAHGSNNLKVIYIHPCAHLLPAHESRDWGLDCL